MGLEGVVLNIYLETLTRDDAVSDPYSNLEKQILPTFFDRFTKRSAI